MNLPSVTLVCIDCVNIDAAIHAIEVCKSKCSFADVKFFTSTEIDYPHHPIRHIGSLNDYSAFALKELPKHVHTRHALIVQWDGFILNPESWRPQWLEYDYIAPLFLQDRVVNSKSVGAGGFNLRSARLMRYVSDLLPPWDGVHSFDGRKENFWGHEDGVISHHFRDRLEMKGFRFSPPHEAAVFAQGGNKHPDYYVERPFGFHKPFPNINTETGFVSPFL